MSHRNWILVLGLLALASLTWAQTTQPAPATRPSLGGIMYPNVIAVGDWSQPVDDLVGRWVVTDADGTGHENRDLPGVATGAQCSASARSILNVYVNIAGIKCEMRDAAGQLVPMARAASAVAASGRRPVRSGWSCPPTAPCACEYPVMALSPPMDCASPWVPGNGT